MDDLLYNPFSSRMKHKSPPGGIYREEWERMTIAVIMEMLTSRFKWTGLPEEIPPLYFESKLAKVGHILLFEDSKLGYMAGVGTIEGLNHYEEPTHYGVVSPTYSKRYQFGVDKAVLIKNNSRGSSDYSIVRRYVRSLAEIKMIQGINQSTLKTPYMISANDKTKSSIIRQLDLIEQGETRIIVDPKLAKSGSRLEVLNLDSPYYVDKLQQQYINVKQELLEIMGINTNPQINKVERVTVGETQANSQEIGYHLLSHYVMREEGAKKASEVLDREITVELRGLDDIAGAFHGADEPGLSNGAIGSVDQPRSEESGDESGTD